MCVFHWHLDDGDLSSDGCLSDDRYLSSRIWSRTWLFGERVHKAGREVAADGQLVCIYVYAIGHTAYFRPSV